MPVRGWPTMMIGRTICCSATAGCVRRHSSMRRRFDRSVTMPPSATLTPISLSCAVAASDSSRAVEALLPASARRSRRGRSRRWRSSTSRSRVVGRALGRCGHGSPWSERFASPARCGRVSVVDRRSVRLAASVVGRWSAVRSARRSGISMAARCCWISAGRSPRPPSATQSSQARRAAAMVIAPSMRGRGRRARGRRSGARPRSAMAISQST